MNWTRSPEQDFTMDDRGWDKGKARKWGKKTRERIRSIHKQLKNDPYQFYTGATAVDTRWRELYLEPPPPLRTIGRIMAQEGLSDTRRKGRNKGAARYLCYPEYTIYNLLGGRVLEADFIGKKHIGGRTEPLNFIGFSFKKEPKLRYFKRIQSQNADNIIGESKLFFEEFEKPDFIKVDNGPATIGSASGKRNISRFMKFVLQEQVVPIFSVPRRPFSQASIEGNNSVFARKFWNRIHFTSVEEVDEKLQWFNRSSEQYTGYTRPRVSKSRKKEFIPRVYFIRQVREDGGNRSKGYINILNEKIFLPKSYVNYFVLVEWNLKSEQLIIFFEKEQQSKIIKNLSFKINSRSKTKCSHFI